MRRFLKKFTEGSVRNSRLSNRADVTKIRKTRVVRVSEQNTRASHYARIRIMHINENVVSSKSTKAIVKAVN